MTTWPCEVNPVWAVYFLCFIILTNLTLVNLVTGLIITGVVEHAREDNWTWQQRLVEEAPFIKAIHDFAEQKLPDIWNDASSFTSESLEVLLSDPGLEVNTFSGKPPKPGIQRHERFWSSELVEKGREGAVD